MKRYGYVLVAAAALLLAETAVAGEMVRKNYHETFPVEPDARLRLLHGDGDVTIRPWERNEIEVTVRYRAEYSSLGVGDESRFRVEFRHDGNEVEVIEERRTGGFFGFRLQRTHEYTYTIHAPAGTSLDLDGDDGDVDIEGWRARIDLSLDDGDVRLRDVKAEETTIELGDGSLDIERHEGDLDVTADDGDVSVDGAVTASCAIRVEDGDVHISRSEGDFRIDTDDGEIRLRDTAARRLRIETGDGDIDLALLPVDGVDYSIDTDDGDVDLALPPGFSAVYTVDVDDGSIRISLPGETETNRRRHRVSGTLGDGNGQIRISGQDGRIRIRESR